MFFKNFLNTFATKLFVTIVGVVSTIIIARVLGVESQGIFALVVATSSVMVLFCGLGVQVSNVYWASKDKKGLNAIFSNSLLFVFIVGIFNIGLYYFIKNLDFISFLPAPFLLISFIAVPFILLQQCNHSILLGRQAIKAYNTLSVARVGILLLSNLLLVWLLKLGIKIAMLGWFVSIIIVASYSIYLVAVMVDKFKIALDPARFRNCLRVGLKAFIGGVVSFLLLRSDMYLIGYFHDVKNVGFYSVAVLTVELMLLAPQAAGELLFPKASAKEKYSSILAAKINRMAIFFTFFLSIGIVIFGKSLIMLFFGNEFAKSYLAILFLIPGIFAINSGSTLGYFIAGDRGYSLVQIAAISFALVVNISLNIILIPRYGIAGAAFATSIAYILFISIYCIYFSKLTRIRLKDFLIPRLKDFNLRTRTEYA